MEKELSIIIPTLKRPVQLSNLINQIRATAPKDLSYEIIAIPDSDDEFTLELLLEMNVETIVSPKGTTPIQKWNLGLSKSKGNWIFQGADDILFPPNWWPSIMATPNQGFIALSDGRIKAQAYEPHYLATREWLKTNQNGVLAVPHYFHWGNDVEIGERANKLGHFVRAGIVFPHNHYVWNTAKKDSTYSKAEKYHKIDLETLNHRRSLGYPNDFQGVI